MVTTTETAYATNATYAVKLSALVYAELSEFVSMVSLSPDVPAEIANRANLFRKMLHHCPSIPADTREF